ARLFCPAPREPPTNFLPSLSHVCYPVPLPQRSPLFPYTTLFRSVAARPALPEPAGSKRYIVDPPGGRQRDTLWGIAERHLGNPEDRKSTRLNSSHDQISYAVFCLKKKK